MGSSVNYNQTSFRGRLADAVALDAAFDAGDPSENANFTIDAGVRFRIRWHITETNGKGSSTQGVSMQVSHVESSQGYQTIVIDNQASLQPLVPRGSSQYSDGDTISTERLTNQGGTFAGGSGDSTDNDTPVPIDATEGEAEYCVLGVRYWYDGSTLYEIDDGDTLQLRCVENDDTLFTTYTNTPTITVNFPDYWLGGVFAETFFITGPWGDSNGNLYALMEASESYPRVQMMKSTDGGVTWAEVDGSNRPSQADFEGCDGIQVGDTIHIIHCESSHDVYYHTFRTSDHSTDPDTWDITDSTIRLLANDNDLQVGTISAPASNGDIVAVYQESDGTNQRVYYKVRHNTVWGGANSVDSTASTDFYGGVVVMEPSRDVAHIFYKDQTNGVIYHKKLSYSVGWLLDSSRQTVESDAGTDTANELSMTNAVPFGTGNKVMIAVQDDSDDYLYSVVVDGDGSPGTRKQICSVPVHFDGGSSRRPTAFLAADGSDVYCFFVDASTQDIWYTKSENDGTWDTPTELLDGKTVTSISGTVFTHNSGNGGKKVVGLMYDEADGYTGELWYAELELSVPPVTFASTSLAASTTPAADMEITLAYAATSLAASSTPDTATLGLLRPFLATALASSSTPDTVALALYTMLTASALAASSTPDTAALQLLQGMTASALASSTTPDTTALQLALAYTASALAASTTPDTALDIARNFTANAAALSSTPDTAALGVVRGFAAAALAASATPDTVTLNVGAFVSFVASALAASTTPDTVALQQLLAYAATSLASSTTPDTATLALLRPFTATSLAASATPDTVALMLYKAFASASLAASATPDTASLDVTRLFSSSMLAASSTPDTVALQQLLGFSSASLAASSTPDTVNIVLGGLVDFVATCTAASSTPAVQLQLALAYAASALASSVTPDTVSLTNLLTFSATALAQSSTPSPVLAVLRHFVATSVAASSTPSTALEIARSFTANAQATSVTSDAVALNVGMFFTASALASSATPDNVTINVGAFVYLAAQALASSTTPAAALEVLRPFVAQMLASSTTPAAVLEVLRGFASSSMATSATPVAALQVLRGFTSASLASSSTPDTVDLVTVLIVGLMHAIVTASTPSVSVAGQVPSVGAAGNVPSVDVDAE